MAQVSSHLNQIVKQKGLFFQTLIEEKGLSTLIRRYFECYRDRIFGPKTTLLLFLSQILSADKSCTDAVARLNSERASQGLDPVSPDNSAYCRSRERLPLEFIQALVFLTAQQCEQEATEETLWKGRRVLLTDGSTLTMADTSSNQEEYPQHLGQGEGIGSPITRLVALFSLATGCVLDMQNGAYRGKGTGEHSLLRALLHNLKPGDILIGDAYFSSYFLMAHLTTIGVDCLFAYDGRRSMDFRTGDRVGKKDHVVCWHKPQKPAWMTQEEYDNLPDIVRIRECVVVIDRKGFRSKSVVLVGTLLDTNYAPKQELGWLYSQRWSAELNLRDLKSTLKMEHLRSKTPQMVRKEIWTTFLAYNLIRKLIMLSAHQHGMLPREISFKGTVQHVNAFRVFTEIFNKPLKKKLLSTLLTLISKMKVANRPGRIEPRAIKKRPRPVPRLQLTRALAREKIRRNCMR
jgi:putative transposase